MEQYRLKMSSRKQNSSDKERDLFLAGSSEHGGGRKKKKKTVAGQKIDFHYEFQAIIVPINLTLLGFGFFSSKKRAHDFTLYKVICPSVQSFFFLATISNMKH